MDENQDVGALGSGDGKGVGGFEDRVRELFQDGVTTRGVSAAGVIRGARRRRVRHRATVAGSSLAVLGVAAGAVAFGAHSAGPSRASAQVASATAPKTPATSAGPATSASPAPKTCSASVTGTVPATTSTTVDGLDFTTISGTTMGIPWAEQIHVFPNKQAHTDWMSGKPSGTYPTGAADAFHEGAVAQFRTPGEAGYEEVGVPATAEDYFSFDSARGLGPGTPVPGTSTTGNGTMAPARMTFKAYLVGTWMDPKVDHLCLQYADHAEFVPVYRTQGAAFIEFGFVVAEQPQEVIGYDASGQVVGTTKAVMMPAGLPLSFQPWGGVGWPQD